VRNTLRAFSGRPRSSATSLAISPLKKCSRRVPPFYRQRSPSAPVCTGRSERAAHQACFNDCCTATEIQLQVVIRETKSRTAAATETTLKELWRQVLFKIQSVGKYEPRIRATKPVRPLCMQQHMQPPPTSLRPRRRRLPALPGPSFGVTPHLV
jgi:hypothetical protein